MVRRAEGELAHPDVPGEVSGFHDSGQVVEGLYGRMVERVFPVGSKPPFGGPGKAAT